MPYIPPEVVAKVREMDLLIYLRNYEPQKLVHYGGSTYCTCEHDSLKIANGKWCWFSRGIGGTSARDHLIKVKDIPFMEAVERIMGQGGTAACDYQVQRKEPSQTNTLFRWVSENVRPHRANRTALYQPASIAFVLPQRQLVRGPP